MVPRCKEKKSLKERAGKKTEEELGPPQVASARLRVDQGVAFKIERPQWETRR